MTANQDHPKCYYHPKQKITSICLHTSCILPLCQYCIQIHRKQFPHGQHMSRIVSFKQASSIALQSIQTEKQLTRKSLEQFDNKFFEFRVAIKSITQNLLNQLEFKLKTEKFKFGSNIANLQQKQIKIMANSLKQLIHHYQHGNIFTNPRFTFNFSINQQKAFQFINNAVQIRQQQFTNVRDSGCDLKIVQPKIDASLWNNSVITEQIPDLPQSNQKNKILTISELNQTPRNKQSIMQGSRTISKRKSRQGIFVASSPSHMKKINKYQSMEIKPRKQFNLEDGIKQNQSNTLNRKLYSSGIFAKPVTPKQTQQSRITQTNKSMGSYPTKVLLYKNIATTPKKRLQLNSKSEKKQKDWNNVVNKCDLASNSSSSRLAIKTNDILKAECLNPQQMRQLIMKKRHKKTSQFYEQSATKILQQKLVINRP